MSNKIVILSNRIKALKETRETLIDEGENTDAINILIEKKEKELNALNEEFIYNLRKEEDQATINIDKNETVIIKNNGYPNINVFKFLRTCSLTKNTKEHVALSIEDNTNNNIDNIEKYIKLIHNASILYGNQILGKTLHIYQLSVYGNGKWYSKKDVTDIRKLIEEFNRLYNDADGGKRNDLLITLISARYTVGEPVQKKLESINPTAYGRDKNFRYNNGYYICTPANTTKECVSLAFATWFSYINIGRINNIKYPALLNSLAVSLYTSATIKSIKDIRRAGYEVIVLYEDDQLNTIKPIDTINSIVLFYSKEHVEIIMHENYLDRSIKEYLNYFCKPRHNGAIICKKIKEINKDIINTIDLECIRTKHNDYILHKVICISYCLDDIQKCNLGYDCINKFLDFLDTYVKEYRSLTFWCHYSSGYDAHLLIDHILPRCRKDIEYPIEFIDTNQSIISIKFNLHKYSITIKDSYRLLLKPLSMLCESFNVESPKIQLNPTEFKEEDFNNESNLAVKYALTDAICLKQVMMKFKQYCINNDLPDPTNFTTITSMSKHYYISYYYPRHDQIISLLNKQAYDFIKRSYFGGITKAFIKGLHKDIYTYDINSSYPYAATKLLPCGNPMWSKLDVIIISNKLVPISKCFIECDIIPPKHKKYTMPIHMYRHPDGSIIDNEDEGKQYTQVVYVDEIKLGLKYGYIYKTYSYLSFTNKARVLAEFNRDLYKLKSEAKDNQDIVKEHIFKLLMNSNYGSWGFNKYDKTILRCYSDNKENLQHCALIEELNEGQYTRYDNHGIFSIQKVDINMKDVNVALAAAITSRARIRLFKISKLVEDLGYKIYYCDTDSIKTNMKESPNHKYFGNKLGQAKKEHIGWSNVECNIYQKKLLTTVYEKDNKQKIIITSKGLNVKKKLRENSIIIDDTTEEDIRKVHEDMKQCYINNVPYIREETMIYTGRTNHIKDLPALYEKIVTKTIKIK